MAQSVPVKRQADMIRELGWTRAKASYVYNGQQYTQALIDELSVWLNVRPWEMLMPPAQAMKIRQVMKTIEAVSMAPPEGVPALDPRTGTDG